MPSRLKLEKKGETGQGGRTEKRDLTNLLPFNSQLTTATNTQRHKKLACD